MARIKAYSAEQVGKGQESAVAGIRAINKYKKMLVDQRRIMGTWDFNRWCEQHGFNNDLTITLLERERNDGI